MLVDHYKLTLKSRRIEDMTPASIAALPAEVRPHVTALRAHYDEVMLAKKLAPARPRHRCDRVRQPRLAPAADAGREDESARVLQKSRTVNASITTPPSAR